MSCDPPGGNPDKDENDDACDDEAISHSRANPIVSLLFTSVSPRIMLGAL
jgi:hypothetical protein